MLIQSLRPQTFSSVVGNQLNNKILLSLAKNPDRGPSTIILQGTYGSGKSISCDSLVPTPEGFVKASDIKEGDLLFGKDGNPVSVLGVFPQGKLDTYKVTFSDGRSVLCSLDHIWRVKYGGTETDRVLSEIINILGSTRQSIYVPLCNPVEYSDREFAITPYAMGLLLSNSILDKGTVLYKNTSRFFPDNLIDGVYWKNILVNDYYVPVNAEGSLILKSDFYGDYLSAVSENRIPSSYLYSSIQQRWELLQGFMDSHGEVGNTNTVTIPVYSKNLADSILSLSYSLGLSVSCTRIKDSYLLYFSIDGRIIKNLFKNYKYPKYTCNESSIVDSIKIKSIKKEESQQDMVCFLVDSEDHLYLCNDYIVTHNTTSSRLFAKALNCKDLKDNDVCGECSICRADLNNVPWYMEFDSTAMGNVDSIRDLRDVFMSTSRGYRKVIVLDECLDYKQNILCRYNGAVKYINIGFLVNHRLPVEVMSYNFDKSLFEWKPVTGWHKNSKKLVARRAFKREDNLRTYFLTSSDNHRVFRSNGEEIFVKDLKEGDKIIVCKTSLHQSVLERESRKQSYYIIPDDTEQMILGTLLRDSSMSISIATYIGKSNGKKCHGGNTYDLTVEDNHNYIANGILVHNCHTISKVGQSALLKVFEETPKGVFFLLPTTDPDKLLPTIRSRSLELIFTAKPISEVKADIARHAKDLDLCLSDSTIDLIAVRSKGIMRNAHMLLDKVNLIGEEEFVKSDISSCTLINDFMRALLKKDKDLVLEAVSELSRVPISYLKDDWQSYFLSLIKGSVHPENVVDPMQKAIIDKIGVGGVVTLVRSCTDSWVINSFQSQVQVQTALLALFQMVSI